MPPALPDLTDAELARRIAGAAPGAARAEETELCQRLGPRVRLYGLRHLGSDDAAQDLAQQVLELVLTKLRKRDVREVDRIASFALGVARMQTHATRRRGRREQPGADAEPSAPPCSAIVPEPEPLARERLGECLQALPERERSVVLLSYFHEQGAPAIGNALGLDAGHVRVIRHRAVERLRTCMGLNPSPSEEAP